MAQLGLTHDLLLHVARYLIVVAELHVIRPLPLRDAAELRRVARHFRQWRFHRYQRYVARGQRFQPGRSRKRPSQPVTRPSSRMGYRRHQQMAGIHPAVVQEIGKALRPHPTMDAVIERPLVGPAGYPLDRLCYFIQKSLGRSRTSLRVPSASGLKFPLRQPVE